MKRIMLICIILIIAVPVNVSAETRTFTDVNKSHWAYEAVMKMAESGIVSGYPDGSFQPGEPVTYAEFIKMATVAGYAIDSGVQARKGQHWAKPYYDAGLNNFYYTEYDIKEAALDQPIPRGYMALIASQMMKSDVKVSDYGDYDKILDAITDVDYRTPYEYEIVKAYATGVLSGYPDGTFRPNVPLSRGEAAAVISRLTCKVEIPPWITDSIEDEEGPLVVVGSVDSSEPDGTLTFTLQNYGKDLAAQQAELISTLSEYCPEEAETMYQAVIDFAAKTLGPGGQGMRKQYFGNYPVLMEHVDTVVRIFIYPVGYNDEYWRTKPGEINEFFF